MNLDGAVQAIVDRLTAAGLRAVKDGRDLNPPCVLVRPPTMHFRVGKDCWDADMEAWAVVPSTGHRMDLPALGDLVTATQDALGGLAAATATPDEVALPDGGTAPMYRLTWSQRVPA